MDSKKATLNGIFSFVVLYVPLKVYHLFIKFMRKRYKFILVFFVVSLFCGCSLKGQIILNTGENLKPGITEVTTTDAETKATLTE